MVSLNWCKKQFRGISLIEENEDLSKSYLDESWDSFEACLKNDGKWKVITGYYACYNALYSILIRCGIKSEIHDCSIRLMELFEFDSEDVEFMEDLKKKRINCQYYLKDVELEDISLVKSFVSNCELILNDLTCDKIQEIRGKLK